MDRSIRGTPLPPETLLAGYHAEPGNYVDCLVSDLLRAVTLGELITAFYNSSAFRLERWLLGAVLKRRANDADAARLASGEAQTYSAWRVEARRDDEILLCDLQGSTRSWLMVKPVEGGTRLHFGSVVVRSSSRIDRGVFWALLPFHRFYARALLASAAKAFRD